MLSFGVKGEPANGAAIVDSLKLASSLANVRDAKTVNFAAVSQLKVWCPRGVQLVIYPFSWSLSCECVAEKAASGTPADPIRVSIGSEHIK